MAARAPALTEFNHGHTHRRTVQVVFKLGKHVDARLNSPVLP